MKKIIYVFFLLFSFISLGSAYAEDYYTNPQDLGQGTETVNNADAGTGAGNNNIADSMSQVTQNGMQELDSVVDSLITDVDIQANVVLGSVMSAKTFRAYLMRGVNRSETQ